MDQREFWGCGYDDRYRGRAQFAPAGPLTARTCPQWYARQPFTHSIYELLEDYRRGAMGNVLHLPASLFDYLRTLDAELQKWDADANKQVARG